MSCPAWPTTMTVIIIVWLWIVIDLFGEQRTWVGFWTWVLDYNSMGKNVPAMFPGCSRRNSMLKVCGIDSYDELLLPGYRLLAQLPVFASGEHFKCRNFPVLQYCTLPYTNWKMRHEFTIGKYTVLQYGRILELKMLP